MNLLAYKRFKIFRLLNLIRNRFNIGFNNSSEALGFLVTLIPPVNIFFSFICKISTFEKNKGPITKSYVYLLSKGIGWGAIRHISPETRRTFAKKEFLNRDNDSDFKEGVNLKVLENLELNGFSSLGVLFEPNEIAEALAFFREQEYFDAQVPTQGDLLSKKDFLKNYVEGQSRYRSIRQIDSLRCKQVNDFLGNSYYEWLSKEYLGNNTTNYSVGTFATFPGNASHYVLKKHRDFDHFSSLTFFIAWTDTSDKDGATIYYPKTHRFSYKNVTPISLSAKAGEVFVLDTFGFHSGNPFLKKIRVATWVRRGTTPNYATILTGEK